MSKKQNYSPEAIASESVEKINQDILLLKKELFNLRFRLSSGEKLDTSLFHKSRKTIARLNTELTRRKNKVGE